MTAQITEKLNYKGQALSLCGEPLASYFQLAGKTPPFEWPHTALWRGYVGAWEIIDDRLYLVVLNGWANGGQPVDLSFVFPDCPELIFAHWVTGRLRATCGKQLKYIHAGYASVYEQDLFFDFEGGVLQSFEIKNNLPHEGK